MKQIDFSAENYLYDDKSKSYIYQKTEDSFIGLFELLYQGINGSPCKDLTTRDHKVVKRLKKKLREISIYKDNDNDSRILAPKTVGVLVLEGDEYEMLKKLFSANVWFAMISDDVDVLWDKIDNAKEYQPPKPTIVKNEPIPGSN